MMGLTTPSSQSVIWVLSLIPVALSVTLYPNVSVKVLNNIKYTQINILCIEKIAIFAKSNLIDLFILT